jgi:hypothetical protein
LNEAKDRAARLGPSTEQLFAPFAGLDLGLLPSVADTEALSRFYELLQGTLRPQERRMLGQYFTPRPLVRTMWSLALDALKSIRAPRHRLRVIDPALGSGAFLVEGLTRGLDGRQLLGVEILPSAARTATVNGAVAAAMHRRLPPRVLQADAYAHATEELLLAHAREGEALLVIGNPPYNGASALLKDAPRLRSAQERLLPFAAYHAPHSGFRDDFAYFFGLAHRLVARTDRPGVICLITPTSLLEARDYLGLRHFLLEHYGVQVVEVGPGAFPDARVATCITVLTHGQRGARYHPIRGPRLEALDALATEPGLAALTPSLEPSAPDYPFRPVRRFEALEIDVDPVTEVLQRWFTPHKTGFDELLVDADSERLWNRLRAVAQPSFDPAKFAARFGARFATERVRKKLQVVHEFARSQSSFPVRRRLRPYLRYNPREATFAAPEEQWQHCYFEPRISTRFNHAFKGTLGRFRPHEAKPQLIFNTFEAPLYAMVVERPGVLHLYQHARFAPLYVPESCYRARGSAGGDWQGEGAPVLNLTPSWQERAGLLRRPADIFFLVAGIYQSALVQKLFGPEQGKRAAVPIKRFDAKLAKVAQRIADRTRLLAAMEERGVDFLSVRVRLDEDVLRLYLGEDLHEAELRATSLAQLAL